MEATGSIGMNGGEGENSYAKNSDFQAHVQQLLVPLLEAAVADLCRDGVPNSVAIADLGCSSGPNALALVSAAAAVLRRTAAVDGGELCVYLNDLLGNDFNTVFGGVPAHFPPAEAEQDGEGAGQPVAPPLVFVFGAPGSFYGRLFPAGALHLACSSCSLHWLSKVPQELQGQNPVHKKNICAGRRSPAEVIRAYALQFRNDLSLFLRSRAKELAPGGWLLLSLKGRSKESIAACTEETCWIDVVTGVLDDMASRGVIDTEKAELFRIPIYEPCQEELRDAIEAEGSFEIVNMERHDMVGADDAVVGARGMRATLEALMARHFGGAGVVDDFSQTAEVFLERARLFGGFPLKLSIHVAALRSKC